MYGVAEATAAEVLAQQSHPPSNPDSQDDDLLTAPVPKSKTQVLTEEHDRLLKSFQSRGTCDDVITAARGFLTWYGNAQSANLQDTFKAAVTSDIGTLQTWLKDCLKVSCPACLQDQNQNQSQNQGQSKGQALEQKQATVKAVIVQADLPNPPEGPRLQAWR